MQVTRRCKWCQVEITGYRNKRYCSNNCKQRVFQSRLRSESRSKVTRSYCEHDGVRYPATSNGWVRLSTCPYHSVTLGEKSLEWIAEQHGGMNG